MTVGLVEHLAAFAHAVPGTAPRAVVDGVRQRLLDTIGVQVAATRLDTSAAAARFVRAQAGSGQATAIGIPLRVPAPWAAFLNGVLAHSLDYDDTHLPSILHPSASVVPAALAVAELADVEGPTLAAAVAAGLEITVRLGMAGYDPDAKNSRFFEHGQHATSICGAVGSAASASVLLGHPARRVADAMAIAASMASGVIEANRNGGTVKRLHCGWAAHAGVSAALLAGEGFTGPPTVLEGRFGFFQAFLHGWFRSEELTGELGERWSIADICVKPYPANHFTHAAIDAALELRAAGLRADDVETAELRVATPTVRTIGEPLDRKQAPQTGYEAQFSGPYAIAAALLGGSGLGLGLRDFSDEAASDPRRRALMAKVTVIGDPECDRIYPHQLPAVLAVRTRAGQQLEARVLHNRGGPQRPLSDDEQRTKFRDNVAGVLTETQVAAVERAVHELPDGGRAVDVLAPLAELDLVE
ncbi:MAG: MmgE/PrpD family protein, partial [Acidimicrobiales bacterium]